MSRSVWLLLAVLGLPSADVEPKLF